ncbi:hypothetical protein [Roseovarius autotrophicus]|uniref:hypothetical protein n=1 Tax=Roseovarius autotrophicus TaxID=2824121 RepID=UPI0019DBD583|nr:hypothetical protein [Roseovarius autotrophicus]MBE0453571.1 hypothetical protein [Roseovarius sp.]
MRQVTFFGLVLVLASCGGGSRFDGDGRGGRPMASGPISDACMSSDRRARSPALCGCIQAVANQTLSSAEQRRAVGFYRDPHSAQEVRTSTRPADQRFWSAYKVYADRAEQVCR